MRRRIGHFSVYRRALISYFLVIGFTVAAVSTALFAVYSRRATEDLAAGSEATLQQTAQAADFLHEQVQTVGTALLSERDVIGTLYATDIDRYREYRTNMIFNSLTAVYPFIDFIAIYNAASERYVNPAGLDAATESEFIDRVTASRPVAYLEVYLRRVIVPWDDENEPPKVASFVLRPNVRFQFPPESFIVINVDVSYVEDLLRRLRVSEDTQVLAVNDMGVVVAASEHEFLADVSGNPYLSRLPRVSQSSSQSSMADEESTDASSAVVDIDGRRYLITHVRTENLRWHFISVRPYSSIITNTRDLARTSVVVVLAIVLVAAAMSLVVANVVYNPLKALVARVRESQRVESDEGALADVDEFEVLTRAYDRYVTRIGMLETAVDSDLPALRRSYAHSLLLGSRPDLPAGRDLRDRVKADVDSSVIVVVVATIDRMRVLRRGSHPRDLASATLAVSRGMRDAVLGNRRGSVLQTQENEVAGLVGLSSVREVRDIVLALRELQATIRKHLGVTVSAAVGDAVESADEVHDSFLSARRYLNYRFFRGPESVITADDLRDRSERFAPYPTHISRALVDNLRLRRLREVGRALSEFREVVESSSYLGGLALCDQLIGELLSVFAPLEDGNRGVFEPYRLLSRDLADIDFLQDAMAGIRELCDTIADRLHAQAGDKKAELVHRATRYLEAHFADVNVNLELLADVLGISPGYLGRVFKERTGRYVNDYLNELRVERAKELLLTSDIPAGEVGVRIGMQNASYFFTLFKKVVGTTPARFRDVNRSNAPAASTSMNSRARD